MSTSETNITEPIEKENSINERIKNIEERLLKVESVLIKLSAIVLSKISGTSPTDN